MFAGLEELSRTASTITFGKQTFHLNIYVVQVEDEVECFSLQVAVLPSPETHFNGHVNLVGCEADISGGGPQVQVGGDGAVQFVHTAGVQRGQVETESPGSAGRKYLRVLCTLGSTFISILIPCLAINFREFDIVFLEAF